MFLNWVPSFLNLILSQKTSQVQRENVKVSFYHTKGIENGEKHLFFLTSHPIFFYLSQKS